MVTGAATGTVNRIPVLPAFGRHSRAATSHLFSNNSSLRRQKTFPSTIASSRSPVIGTAATPECLTGSRTGHDLLSLPIIPAESKAAARGKRRIQIDLYVVILFDTGARPLVTAPQAEFSANFKCRREPIQEGLGCPACISVIESADLQKLHLSLPKTASSRFQPK